MNAKIKPWMPWIIVGLIVIALVMIEYLVTYVLKIGAGNQWYYSLISVTILPGAEIARHITLETISWFGSEEYPFYRFLKTIMISAAGFIVLFILAPWFFVKGQIKRNSDNQPSGLTWYFGTAIIILGIAVSTFFGIRQTIVSPKIEDSIESSQMVDKLRSYMSNVAFDAAEWMILPEEKGGGNGSFLLPNGEFLTLDELSSYRHDHPDFELGIEEVPSDSVIIVKGGLANQETENESVQHIFLEITPMNDSVLKFQTNTVIP